LSIETSSDTVHLIEGNDKVVEYTEYEQEKGTFVRAEIKD
jgi:hypothetical protein